MTEDWEMVLSAKHFFLPSYQYFDAGSFYMAFLTGLFVGEEHSYPAQIDLASLGKYFGASAEGFKIEGDLKSLPEKLNIMNYQRGPFLEGQTLPFLEPLVWFSEYCFVDVASPGGSYKQAFMNGKPQTQAIVTDSNNPLMLGFYFNLPEEGFADRKMTFSRCKEIISVWKKSSFVSRIPPGRKPPSLKFSWLKQDEYYYSLRINVLSTQQ